MPFLSPRLALLVPELLKYRLAFRFFPTFRYGSWCMAPKSTSWLIGKLKGGFWEVEGNFDSFWMVVGAWLLSNKYIRYVCVLLVGSCPPEWIGPKKKRMELRDCFCSPPKWVESQAREVLKGGSREAKTSSSCRLPLRGKRLDSGVWP